MAPTQTLSVRDAQDLEEFRSWQLVKRREFEQQLNKNRLNFGQWLRYARWEANECHDLARARSVYERALDVDVAYVPFWVQYIRFELAHKAVSHARNLLDRATSVLPYVAKLWFLAVQTEEALKNYAKVKLTFERWLEWRPEPVAWDAYVSFATRHGDTELARQIYLRYVDQHPTTDTWLKWAALERDQPANIGNTRLVYQTGAERLLRAQDAKVAEFIDSWTQWETSVQEYHRARAIFDTILAGKEVSLLASVRHQIVTVKAQFDRLYGQDTQLLDENVASWRILSYRQLVEADPRDYDLWWQLLKLAPDEATFEAAVAQPPLMLDRKLASWNRYVFIWIRYALWLEYAAEDVERARSVWQRCVQAIPHAKFLFAKMWIEYSRFETRAGGLAEGRKVLGKAIGKTSKIPPKAKLFRYYIDVERKVGEWLRVRKLYEKWMEALVAHGGGSGRWVDVLRQYVDFESSIGEDERVKALVSLAGESGDVHAREFAISWYNDELLYDELRQLYEDAVTSNPALVTTWIAYALFESQIPTDEQLDAFNASDDTELELEITDAHRKATRKVFTRAIEAIGDNAKAHIAILKTWKEYEDVNGDEANQRRLQEMQPIKLDDGTYEFPEVAEVVAKPNLAKFLASAKAWQKKEEAE